MVNTGPDEPSHGTEYPALEKSPAPGDSDAPVDYPSDSGAMTDQFAPPAYQQPAHPQPGYPQSGYEQPGYQTFENAPPAYPQQAYPQPDYAQSGYPPPGYPPPDYPSPGYPQTSYPPPPSGYPPQYPPGPYGYPAYDPYASARPPGTNGKAIAALVTSLVGLMLCGVPSLVGLILGVVAMRETKRTGQEGHGLALAAVVVGVLAVVGWVIYVGFILFAIAVSSPYDY